MRTFGACVFMGFMLFWGGQAVALEVHVPAGSFGSTGSGSGQFNGPAGVAVNDTTHDVYVVDRGNNRVEKFDPTGTTVLCEFNGSGTPAGIFSEPVEIAVDNSGSPLDPSIEDVYVVDRGHGAIDKFNSNCAYESELTGNETPGGPFEAGEASLRAIEGVAVDPSGSVWVSIQNGPIYSFSDAQSNRYVSEAKTVFGGAAEGLAVDAEDNLYFNAGGGVVVKVNSSGDTLENPVGGDKKAFRVAVDLVGHEVYLDNLVAIEAFSSSGGVIESFGSGGLTFSRGVAVDTSDGSVYATDQTANKVLVFEAIILPSVSVGPVSEQQPTSVTLNGTVNPEGKPVSSCVFEYGITSAYGRSAPCSPTSLGSGSTPVAVSAHLIGVTPRITYHYRLVAENVGGKSPSPDQEVFVGPLLGGESVVDVASNSATLKARIDANGADTHYYFQYGPTAAYGSYAPVSPPGVDVGSAVDDQTVSVHLQGLIPGTVYHYRLVGVQGGETFEEPDRSFITQSASEVSTIVDGRVWELASPAEKKGALIELFEQGGDVQVASDGSGITYLAQGPHVGENPAGHVPYSQVLSRRGPDGWGSTDLTLPGRLLENGESSVNITHFQFEYRLFTPDLSMGVVEPQIAGTPPLSPEAKDRTLYLRDNASGSFLPIVSPTDTPARIDELTGTESEWEIHFLAATPDLRHVVFKTPLALTPEAIDEETLHHNIQGRVQWNLYEWGAGMLDLVNILPSGEVAHGPITTAPPVRLADMSNTNGLGRGIDQRDLSNDGRRIAWTWGEPYSAEELPNYRGLYVRDMVEERTMRVGGAAAMYQTMSSDGSRIFFLENGDLYMFDFDTGKQTDLTGAHGPGESEAGVQEAVSDVSEDGSYIYFVATGVLANGGVKGGDNLYLLHATSNGWTTTYIATLSVEDVPSWYASGNFGVPALTGVSSRVSQDGRYLTFMSSQSLTGYDNIDAANGQPDEEVYLYDAQTGKLICASCNPTGGRPVGVLDTPEDELLVDRVGTWTRRANGLEHLGTDHWLAGSVPGWNSPNGNPTNYQPRYLSEDGRTFFDSPDALVPQDTNGLEDVYEYEPEGVGNCTSSTSSGVVVYVKEVAGRPVGGCVGLVSSGTSSSESAFYDASENGNDVFFATTSKLVGEDFDKGYDVYDAHVCSSAVPCVAGPVKPPPCSSGDSCRAAPASQPQIFGPAPSATFNGAGNVTVSVAGVSPKSLTSAQKLARALRDCQKKRGKRRRICERQARRRYPFKHARKQDVRKG